MTLKDTLKQVVSLFAQSKEATESKDEKTNAEMINNAKLILSKAFNTEIKLEKMKLADGITVVEADSFTVDSPIFIITESEDSIPMPIGKYELEDGTIVEVMVEGIIGSIAPKEDAPVDEPTDVPVEAEDAPVDAPAEDTPSDSGETVSKEEYDAKVAELQAIIDDLNAKLNLSIESIATKVTEVEAMKVELANLPAAKKITNNDEVVKTINNNKTANTKFAKILKNLNN